MDPNACLATILELMTLAEEAENKPDILEELVEALANLDDWLIRRRSLPHRWNRQ